MEGEIPCGFLEIIGKQLEGIWSSHVSRSNKARVIKLYLLLEPHLSPQANKVWKGLELVVKFVSFDEDIICEQVTGCNS